MRTMKRVVVKLTSDLVEGCHEERIHKIVGPELAPKVVESGMMAMTGAADRQVLSVATSASEPSPLTRGDITFLSGGQAPRWEDRHSSDPDRAPEPLLWHEALDGGSHDTGARVFGHPLWAPASPLPAICVPTHLAGPEQCSAVLAHAYRTANQLLDAQPDLWDDAHKEAFQQLTSEELASRLTGVARLVYKPPANAERPAAVLGHVCGFREDYAESTTCAWLRYETHEALESVRPFLALNSCQRLKEASYCRVLGKVSSTPHFDVVVTTSDREQTSTGADQALRGIKDVLGFSGSHVHHVPDLRLGDLGGCGAAAAASHAAAARPTTVLEKPSSTFVVLAHGMEASLDEDTSESLASSRGGLCLDLDTVDDEFARLLAGTLASVPGGQSFLQAILVVACNSESTARSLSSLPCLSHVAVLGFEGKISVALSRRFLEEFFRSAKLQCVESSLLACDVERHTRSALSALNAHSMEHAGVPLLCGNFDLASSFVQARFPAGSFSGFGASVLTAVMRPRLYINGEARDIGKPYEFRTADELRELLVEAVGRSGARANDEVCYIQAMLAAPRLGCF
ncbi:hypothetical protein FNF28_02892 [Cafeteria roenbergensis]|uniref:Uncharacterized protein n=1 Tax=Cafeteria roenbergensis TaxID=33653 RepID=A0A5A8DPD4_CAFRO|nr:hypothetical protein FNF28_02892 [Cafeteria roenbergensis]